VRGAESREESARKNTDAEGDESRVIEKPLFRRKSRSVTLAETPSPAKPEPVRRPAKVAQQLALAHHLQAAIDRGAVADRAAVARKLGLTRARITQLLDLLMLAPDLQEAVLVLEAVDGAEPMAERTLRAVAHAGTWAEQREAARDWAGSC
jgi:ParB-like chromosome segregation protein Spo0J